MFSNICEDSYVFWGLLPVLRRLDTKVDSLFHPNFINVAKPVFSIIRIYLKDCFLKEQVVQDFCCTLPLRQAGNNIS